MHALPFTVHKQIMLDDNVVKGLCECVVMAQAECCVEVGSYIGTGSTVILAGLMAARKGRLYCVDHFSLDLLQLQGLDAPHYEQFLANIQAMGFADTVTVLRGQSVEVASTFKQTADLIYIDACHGSEQVESDLLAWLPHLKPGGIICGDDFAYAFGPQVQAGVHAILGDVSSRGRFWWSQRLDTRPVA